jgi:RHS repeat-associated protein
MEFDTTNGALKKEYIYGSSGLVATIEPTNGTRYTTADHLGTPRVITNSTGAVVSRHDYKAFGRELSAGVGGRTTAQGYVVDNLRQKFTGHERDNETGLDFAQARYFASTQGRFTSPDPTLLSVNAFNPQSWNRYTYVLNNPLLYVDPLGLWAIYTKDLYKDKKNKDGSITKVYDRTAVYARKTQDDDNGASLAKQLGLEGNEAAKFAEKIGSGNDI